MMGNWDGQKFATMAGMSLPWDNQWAYFLWPHFQNIATFLAPYNFDESTGNVHGWVAGHDYDPMHYEQWQRKPGIVDLFYLRSPDRMEAVGVLANRTYNFYSQWDAGCEAFVWKEEDDSIAFEKLDDDILWNDQAYNAANTAYYINESLQADVKFGHCYRITYINSFTMQTISSEKKLNATGKLNLNFPYITGSSSRPIVLVKIEKENCFKSQEMPTDSFAFTQNMEEYLSFSSQNAIPDSLLKANVFPNPTDNVVRIDLPLYSDDCIIKLFSCSGLIIKSTIFSGQSFILNLSDVSSGVYILQLTYNQKLETLKIIIQ